MNRRIFLKRSCRGVLFSALPGLVTSCYKEKRVRFGIVTDLHLSHSRWNLM
ncbi:MAG: hypothetical protein LUG51_12020 [Tannerellaceae bacterium]|nr:hypothetical protein [Tannerellaceae bacterium]